MKTAFHVQTPCVESLSQEQPRQDEHSHLSSCQVETGSCQSAHEGRHERLVFIENDLVVNVFGLLVGSQAATVGQG